MTEPLPGAEMVTTAEARAIVERPRFTASRDAVPRGHVAVNGGDLARVEAEAREQGAQQERTRLLRLYGADGLALGWSKDMLLAIERRLRPSTDPEPQA